MLTFISKCFLKSLWQIEPQAGIQEFNLGDANFAAGGGGGAGVWEGCKPR